MTKQIRFSITPLLRISQVFVIIRPWRSIWSSRTTACPEWLDTNCSRKSRSKCSHNSPSKQKFSQLLVVVTRTSFDGTGIVYFQRDSSGDYVVWERLSANWQVDFSNNVPTCRVNDISLEDHVMNFIFLFQLCRCLEEGAEDFLVKPVKLSDVKRLKDYMMREVKIGSENKGGINKRKLMESCDLTSSEPSVSSPSPLPSSSPESPIRSPVLSSSAASVPTPVDSPIRRLKMTNTDWLI